MMDNQLKRIEMGQLSDKCTDVVQLSEHASTRPDLRVVSTGLLPGCSLHGLSRLLLT